MVEDAFGTHIGSYFSDDSDRLFIDGHFDSAIKNRLHGVNGCRKRRSVVMGLIISSR